ncbi:MAG: hypothetical protein ACM336_04215 [Acidobacteriota bacterium]
MNPWRVLALLGTAALAAAQQTPKMYPGAKIDQAGTEEARVATATQPEIEMTVYATPDPFEKVYEYFKKTGKEYKVIGSGARKLPNGQDLKNAFFILDEGNNLVASKRWVKLQRPYIGQYGLARKAPQAQNDIRDVTAIVLTVRK